LQTIRRVSKLLSLAACALEVLRRKDFGTVWASHHSCVFGGIMDYGHEGEQFYEVMARAWCQWTYLSTSVRKYLCPIKSMAGASLFFPLQHKSDQHNLIQSNLYVHHYAILEQWNRVRHF
jgi:hypothetical protein